MAEQKPSSEGGIDDDAERRIDELADWYLSQLQTGEVPDRSAVVAQHPDLAPGLERRLLLIERIFRATLPPGSVKQGGLAATPIAESRVRPDRTPGPGMAPTVADVGEIGRAIHICCPHCGNEIQVADDAPGALNCDSCGSSFAVERPVHLSAAQPFPKQLGKFELMEAIGRGGFGVVFKARDVELGRYVAIKLPRAGYFETIEDQQRFLREARASASLKHPNIAQVYQIVHDKTWTYIVSEFIDGLTLADLVSGPMLTFRESAELVSQVADALDYAHRQGIVHRDVKPSNILIDRSGRPFLADFGLARRVAGEITVTISGHVLGTPAYMSPEQASGHNQVDRRTDVYSLGVILYRLLTGSAPFSGTKEAVIAQVKGEEPRAPRRLNPRVPRDLETICLRAIMKERDRRYASARLLADDLRNWLEHRPIVARPVSGTERALRWCRRHPLPTALSAAIALLILSVVTVTAIAAVRERRLRADADLARANEAQERVRAEQSDRLSLQRAVRLESQRGVELVEQGDLLAALPWFIDALRLDAASNDSLHRTRIAMLLAHSPAVRQLYPHDMAVLDVDVSADGRYVATASADGAARVWDAQSGRSAAREALRHGKQVYASRFSPDGKLVATASADSTARIWNFIEGTSQVLQHQAAVNHVVFSPDGSALATAGGDGQARIWNSSSGEPLTDWLDAGSTIHAIAFTPDGGRLAAASGGSDSGQVQFWNAATAEADAGTLKHRGAVGQIAFSHDGKFLVSVSIDNTAKLWDLERSEQIGDDLPHDADVLDVAFHPDKYLFVTAGVDRNVRLWECDASSVRLRWSARHNASVRDVSFSSDGERIISASRDRTARVWHTANGQPALAPLHHASGLTRGTFGADPSTIVTASNDGICKLWSVNPNEARVQHLSHPDSVKHLQFSPDGRQLAAAAGEFVYLWSSTGQGGSTVLTPAGRVNGIAFSPSSNQLAVATNAETAEVWSLESTPRRLLNLPHGGVVARAAFSPDGSRIATASADRSAVVWNSTDGSRIHTLQHDREVRGITFSPDGRYVATLCEDAVRIWKDQIVVARLYHQDRPTQVSFSPDSRLAVTSSMDGTAVLWDVPTGQRLREMRHGDHVWTASFSPSGLHVLTGSFDRTAQIWDVMTGKPVSQPMRHRDWVVRAAYRTDGLIVATVAGDAIQIWDTGTGEPLSPPLAHQGEAFAVAFSPNGHQLASGGEDTMVRLWDLTPVARPISELRALSHVLGSHTINDVGARVPVSAAEQQEAWRRLR